MYLKEQSDSKEKCLILKNLYSMSFWDLGRIDANDSMNCELGEKGFI